MKKCVLITVLSLSVVIFATVAGCNKTENPESSNDSTSTSNQTSVTESTKSTQSTESTDSEPLSDEVREFLEKYPIVAEYVGYDGKKIPTSEIASVDFGNEEEVRSPTVTYNLSYITYGVPCYADTLDGSWKTEGDYSTIYDWISDRRDKAEKEFANSEYIMVKPGDKLENGLVVKSAKLVCYTSFAQPGAQLGSIDSDLIEFDGELTLEGVLYKYEGDPQYFSVQNDVFFLPDTTKNEFVPMYRTNVTEEVLDSDVGVIHCGSYYLGNLGDVDDLPSVDYDVDAILGDKNYAHVKITLKDICIGSVGHDSQSWQRAKIADAELLD